MEHLSQLEQKATNPVSRREHRSPRDDRVTKRESLGSFSMRDKGWRTGSPEMCVKHIVHKFMSHVTCSLSLVGSVCPVQSLCTWRGMPVLLLPLDDVSQL